MSFICKKCGHEISENDAYCKFCGAPINNTVENNESVSSIIALMFTIAVIAFVIFFIFDYLENENSDDTITNQEGSFLDSANENEETLPQGPFNYSIGGITFEIPDNYYYEDGSFSSDYSRLGFENEKVEDFWNVYLYIDNAAFNDMADQQIGEVLSNPYRELSQSTYVAGNKSLLYVYTGEINDEPVTVMFAIIICSDSESAIYVYFETPNDSNEEIADFEDILDDAEVTGAADSTSDPRSIFYIDEEQTVEE